jgi:phosphate starvation-inducible PhoH-like protein
MVQQRKQAPSKKSEVKEFSNTKVNPFIAKTHKQKELFSALNGGVVTFATGPAGTGKSYVTIAYACQELMKGRFDKILITRPMIPAAYEDIGALPGDIDLKFVVPYIGPIRHILDRCLGKGHVDMYIKEGKITCSPLAYMRGSTHDNTFMLLDEAQNCVPEQVKMFLTRIGEDSKIAIVGDSKQSDIRGVINGLDDAVERLAWNPDVRVVNFERKDIVRNSIIADILQSYEDTIDRRGLT